LKICPHCTKFDEVIKLLSMFTFIYTFLNVLVQIANKMGFKKIVVVTLRDSCEVRTESCFHSVVVTLCDSCEVRTESRFHFVV
jgi:hypothetical protein